jgi:hypothetical protein
VPAPPPQQPAPETPLSRRAERNPATPNPVSVSRPTGNTHTRFTVSFRALLNGANYDYVVIGGGSPACQRKAGGFGGGLRGGPPTARGQTITTSIGPPYSGWCPGTYRVFVSVIGRNLTQNFPFGSARFQVTG